MATPSQSPVTPSSPTEEVLELADRLGAPPRPLSSSAQPSARASPTAEVDLVSSAALEPAARVGDDNVLVTIVPFSADGGGVDPPQDEDLDSGFGVLEVQDQKQLQGQPGGGGKDPDDSDGGDDESEEEVPVHQRKYPRGDLWFGLHWATEQHEILPYHPQRYKDDLPQIKAEVLAGITVAFAQVSESIAFAFIAGVGPLLGLHAAWIIGLSLSFFGSRSAMMNGATGVRAAVLAPFVKEEGIGMLFYIVCAISVFQLLAALLRVAKFVRMIPRPAMIGFVNGLAIILALGQINQFQFPNSDEYLSSETIGWMWFLVAVTVLASLYAPRIPMVGKLLPPSLWGIVFATVFEHVIVRAAASSDTPTIGDLGKVDGAFPKLFWLDPQYDGQIPALTWTVVGKTIRPAFIAAAAGMVEAVMTMEVVNDLTETINPNPNQQLLALSIGNFISGMLGTMGGGATIGLSMINVHNGANGYYRISGVVSGFTMLILILAASSIIKVIPTASLVGVMVIVCFHTFEWSSLPIIVFSAMPLSWRSRFEYTKHHKIQRVDALIIVIVTVVTLVLDLFTAVLIGVLFSAAAFAWDTGAKLNVVSQIVEDEDGNPRKIIRIDGPVFFASAMKLLAEVRPSKKDPDDVEIHFKTSQISDFTGIHAMNVLGEKYSRFGKRLHLRHLNVASLKILRKADKLTQHFTYDFTEEVVSSPVKLEAPQALNVTQSYDKIVV